MNCPYCAEDIKDAAIVCKHCHRDLFVILPMMEKLADFTRRLQTLEAGVTAQSSTTTPTTDPAVQAPAEQPKQAPGLPSISAPAAMAIAYIALILSHFIIIIQYDLPLIALRLASIAIPLIFGFLCRQPSQRAIPVGLAYGVVIAAAAILSMSAITGRIDNTPVLPRNAYEWREFAEYGASIAFGFLTGVIIRQIVNSMRAAALPAPVKGRRLSIATRMVASRFNGKFSDVELVKIESVVRTGAAVISGIVSISTGLKQFL